MESNLDQYEQEIVDRLVDCNSASWKEGAIMFRRAPQSTQNSIMNHLYRLDPAETKRIFEIIYPR